MTGRAAGSVAALLLLAVVGEAGAQMNNGSFETGDLSGWSPFGSAYVTSWYTAVRPMDYYVYGNSGDYAGPWDFAPDAGQYMAVVQAAWYPSTDVEAFLGLPSGTIAADSGNEWSWGSAIKQRVYANAGDTVNFSANFVANDTMPYNDFAFLSVSSTGSHTVDYVPLGSVEESLWWGCMNSSFGGYDYTFPSSGVYTLGFACMNQGTPDGASVLLVDDVFGVRSVPEPAFCQLAVLLALGAAAALGIRLRERRRRTPAQGIASV